MSLSRVPAWVGFRSRLPRERLALVLSFCSRVVFRHERGGAVELGVQIFDYIGLGWVGLSDKVMDGGWDGSWWMCLCVRLRGGWSGRGLQDGAGVIS